MWMAETQQKAHKSSGQFEIRYDAKYPKAAEWLTKDKVKMLAFYDFTAEHWTHIRTTNPIKSMFAKVRIRTNKTKNCGSLKTTLPMVCKLIRITEVNCRRLRGLTLLADISKGMKFRDGIREANVNHQDTSLEVIHQI
uniref:transposase n=2 Tax=Candidatus Enterovibrio escicola TaxID=1927127 RepID=UPI0037434FDC